MKDVAQVGGKNASHGEMIGNLSKLSVRVSVSLQVLPMAHVNFDELPQAPGKRLIKALTRHDADKDVFNRRITHIVGAESNLEEELEIH